MNHHFEHIYLNSSMWNISFFVGGFNPSEKYARQIGSFPQIGMETSSQNKPQTHPPWRRGFAYDVEIHPNSMFLAASTFNVAATLQLEFLPLDDETSK